jgi:hypothetical protein
VKLTKAGVRLPFILSATVILTGCLAPETINADITTDGSAYTLRIESIVAEPRAVMAAAEGRLSAQDDEGARMAANDADMPGFERFEYVGEGRFELVVDLAGKLAQGESVGFPNTRANADNYLRVERLEDGTIEISTPEVPASNIAQLNQLPFKPTGTVRVTPAATDRVLDHNADRAPALLDRAYMWNVEAWEDRIFIKIKPQGG